MHSPHSWPTESQNLLLRAALADGQPARDAWHAWRSGHDLENMDEASYNIVPQLYLNLARLGVDDPATKKLKAAYLQTWTTNNVNLRDLGIMLNRLQQAGIRSCLLKGMPLALYYYQDLGARMMGDLDLLVSPADFVAAARVLQGVGWQPEAEHMHERNVAFSHAVSFYSPGRTSVDLHRCPFPLGCLNSVGGLLERATERQLCGTTAYTPDPIDMLLVSCFHGRKGDLQSVCRWIADVVTLLKSAGASIDWDALSKRSRDLRLEPIVRDALLFVHREFPHLMTAERLARACPHDGAAADVARYRRVTRRGRGTLLVVHKLWLNHWRRYTEQCLQHGKQATLFGFFRYFAEYCSWRFSIRSLWRLPFRIVLESAKRLKRIPKETKS